jgi:Cft2 family RNA processing exonuclease
MFTLKNGTIYAPALQLWIDSMQRRQLAYVSHGHADHARPHELIISSPANAEICDARFSRRFSDDADSQTWNFEIHPFNEPWKMGDYQLTLFPAGHVLGSSQLMIEGEAGRFVYTGDFKLEQAFTAETTEVKHCDTVLMECTYGKPQFVFPPREEIAQAIVAFAREALDEGFTPVFYAYSLGKAQEAMAILGNGGIPITVHGAVASMADIYRRNGVALPTYLTYQAERFEAESALIWPPGRGSLPKALAHLPARTAALSGWALAGGTQRSRTDAVFALSDHADFPSIVRYIELAQPKKVILNHGFRETVRHLQALGIDAEYLDQHPQLTLF